jgi:hypothetical protein
MLETVICWTNCILDTFVLSYYFKYAHQIYEISEYWLLVDHFENEMVNICTLGPIVTIPTFI